MKILTEKFLLDNRTKNLGYTKVQLELIGICWPPKKNWKKKVINKVFDENILNKFEEISKLTKIENIK